MVRIQSIEQNLLSFRLFLFKLFKYHVRETIFCFSEFALIRNMLFQSDLFKIIMIIRIINQYYFKDVRNRQTKVLTHKHVHCYKNRVAGSSFIISQQLQQSKTPV